MESGKHELPNMSAFTESESSEQDTVKIEVKEDDDDDGLIMLEGEDDAKTEIVSDQEDHEPKAMDDSMDE